MTVERLTLWLLLAATFAIRAIHPDQPIVENYVGRQIPTAMVARNLERGSGFLHPQLDTGPFPNLFLVEPPIYAQVVAWIHPRIGFDLEATGRLVSAAATALAGWGLFGLARRREGPLVAFLALASFSLFPVMLRYGRAFQPDALMLGCVLAGLRGWDEFEATGHRRWLAFGGFVLATGLALKITVAWALIPFYVMVRSLNTRQRQVAAVAMLGPALAWYLHASVQLASTQSGSLASFDNANLWARSFSPLAWLRFSTYSDLGRGLVLGSFTPVGFVLAGGGLLATGRLDRVWLGWGLGCALSIFVLASKWHHTYYWMVVAPLAAIGVGRALVKLGELGRCGRISAATLGSILVGLCLYQSASTWRTPAEWADLGEASREVAVLTTTGQRIAAPEALLYYAGRPGYRLEFDPPAARRAAGEWGYHRDDGGWPLALTEFYWRVHNQRTIKARWLNSANYVKDMKFSPLVVADVGPAVDGSSRQAWRSALRERPGTRVVVDRPGMIVVELQDENTDRSR